MHSSGSSFSKPGHEAGPPLWLLAELTYRCPLQCPYCSNPLDFAEQGAELSTAEWIEVFRQARELGAVQLGFSGGEPLVRQDLAELIAAARGLGYYTNLITSGIGLTEARLRALKDAGLRHIQLGFQSTDRATAQQLAGVDCLERKLGMARAIKAQGFPMVLNVPITRQNIGQIPQIINFAAELGVDYIELANVQYYNWALLNREQLMPTREELLRAEAQVQEARERLGDRLTIFFVIPDYYEGRPKACMNGWGAVFLSVAPDGLAMPCHNARNLPGLDLPNVTSTPLADIWRKSQAFNAYRGEDWMQEPCRSCDERHKDFGGCRCQAFQIVGDAAATDPVCSKSPHHGQVVKLVQQAPARREIPIVFRSDANSRDLHPTPADAP